MNAVFVPLPSSRATTEIFFDVSKLTCAVGSVPTVGFEPLPPGVAVEAAGAHPLKTSANAASAQTSMDTFFMIDNSPQFL